MEEGSHLKKDLALQIPVTRRTAVLIAQICVISAVIGAAYALVSPNSQTRWWGGAVTGATIAFLIATFERFVMTGPFGAGLKRLTFPAYLSIKALIYSGLIILVLAGVGFLMPLNRDWPVGTLDGAAWVLASPQIFFYSLLTSAGFNIVVSINDLLGRGVLLSFITGRYHRPREEVRIFLFFDLVGSTKAAEQLGNLRFHLYLNRVIQTIEAAVLSGSGTVHAYVGDGVMVHWSAAQGLKDGACVRAALAARRRLAAQAAAFEKEFGVVPEIRAALHMGPVVTGEMGMGKREIVFVGDVVNTTARVEEAAKTLGERVLMTQDLLDALTLPPGVGVRLRGPVPLKGKAVPVSLVAVDGPNETVHHKAGLLLSGG